VYQVVQNNNAKVYQLKSGGLSYIVINENQAWSFMSMLEPCKELKEVIIKQLKQRDVKVYTPACLSVIYQL